MRIGSTYAAAVALPGVIAAFTAALTTHAHHSQAPFFDQSRDVEIEGVVQRFDYRNPHAILYVEVARSDGGVDVWSLQFASLAVLMRAGITADVVQPGDRIKAIGHPAWNAESFGMAGVAITTEDGREFVDPLRDGDFTPAAER